MYFQHNPYDDVWGAIHWGHATSEDLLVWEEHDIAIYPDSLGTIFSGNAVVDLNNTSGIGQNIPPIVAMYTNHHHEGAEAGRIDYQTQKSIAYSLDQGFTFTKYENNPVIPNPRIQDFRDPKVTWFGVQNKWVMSLVVGQIIYFYTSSDLKSWQYLSSFGQGIGNHNGVWECPDLIQLPVDGTNQSKWVLLVSINLGGLNGGSATQYFVGDSDDSEFTVGSIFSVKMGKYHDFWIDYGKDNYAGETYSNIETQNGRKILQGWISNWQYANMVPTTTWRSAMTRPREISLKIVNGVHRIVSQSISSIKQYSQPILYIPKSKSPVQFPRTEHPMYSTAEVKFNALANSDFKSTFSNALGDTLVFRYDHEINSFYN